MEEKKNPLYSGNAFWIYEAFKTVNQDFDFDKPYTDKPQYAKNELLIYECLMFNDDREDSLFIMQDGVLYEYFSENKSELLYKLIQYYENRITYNIDKRLVESSQPIKKSNQLTKVINKRFKFNDETFKDPESKFKSTIKGNLFLVFKDKTTKWVYDYELKKLLFYLKFLPRAKEIKLLSIFPLSVQECETRVFNYVDRDDQFVETKEAQLQKVYEESKADDQIFKNFVKKIKSVFYEKYLLNVKKMDLYSFILDGRCYLLDVKNFIFEKFENRHVKLDSEGLYYRYVEKYKESAKMVKNPKKLGAVKLFYDAMLNKYNDLFHTVVSDDYLNHPQKDPSSDQVYHIIKPESPYTLSQLMKPRVNLKTFVKYATDNLWNEDNN